MNSKVKKAWVEALRSGRYKQTNTGLRRGDAFCPLGVLCDLHRKQTGGRWYNFINDIWTYKQEGSYLPDEVSQWAEIGGHNPIVKFNGRWVRLTELGGMSFPELASLIEQGVAAGWW